MPLLLLDNIFVFNACNFIVEDFEPAIFSFGW